MLRAKTYWLVCVASIAVAFLCFKLFIWRPNKLNYVEGDQIKVIDGDSVKIGKKRFRLHGIDAPESNQMCTDKAGKEWACGVVAGKFLETLFRGKSIYYKIYDIDIYHRKIAEFFDPNDTSINQQMVESGLAVAYRKFSKDYINHEDIARSKKIGIWAGPFTEPFKYRQQIKRDQKRKSRKITK